ncbi:hypothetical protein AF335_17295 [Streptomyces eurocidicus]|uniref:Uncharacterized protein n=1 Tax=Streptomyces eurocidicus TaxID=66423 RepID=A0A2N8NUB9_STREU|nr:hypothetical protein [Streptomyces eurocidicus]MBB5120215.1 hypothetical protein [Streptomyces eurocidicus]MBF6056100.1 hypothetical protein [Streptomyces eurocidicus]PNE32367.1 hypothetical protein AF335_17295 [Streptomyces eurocidicus]
MATDSSTDRPVRISEHHRRYLLWAGRTAFIPLTTFIIATAFGKVPWPDVDAGGRPMLDYALKNHCAEGQAVFWFALAAGTGMFLVLVSAVYQQRAERTPLAVQIMLFFGALWTALEATVSAAVLVNGLLGQGYPSYGHNPSELFIVAALWDLTNAVGTMGMIALAIALLALSSANRADPVLPVTLTNRVLPVMSVYLILANLVAIAFFPTGPWSPASIGNVVIGYAPAFLWQFAISFALLRRLRRDAPSP